LQGTENGGLASKRLNGDLNRISAMYNAGRGKIAKLNVDPEGIPQKAVALIADQKPALDLYELAAPFRNWKVNLVYSVSRALVL
jgi:hypothetical protein